MSSENRDKIRYKVNLAAHLEELNCFTKRKMCEADLLSFEKTQAILEQSRQLNQMTPHKFTIPFVEKDSERFRRYIGKLQQTNSSGAYIWTSRSKDCGVLVVGSLSDIKWDFNFTCSPQGVFVLEAVDLQDRVLFDFYEEDKEKYLEIEAKGHHWSRIAW